MAEGGETALSRRVVDALGDPLVHLVRNAADHGIETPDERRRAGKLPAGRLTLRAYPQAGTVVIEVCDDGRGLRKDEIFTRAVEAGIIPPDATLTGQQIFSLIFHPRLTTAGEPAAPGLPGPGGRGVGMAVVKDAVECLGGHVEFVSVEGVGTTFTLRVPVSPAVVDGWVVRCGAERYVLPAAHVERVLRPGESIESLSETPDEAGDIPVLRFDRRLSGRAGEEGRRGTTFVLRDGDRRYALRRRVDQPAASGGRNSGRGPGRVRHRNVSKR